MRRRTKTSKMVDASVCRRVRGSVNYHVDEWERDVSTGRRSGVLLEGYQCFAHTSRSCYAVSNTTLTVT